MHKIYFIYAIFLHTFSLYGMQIHEFYTGLFKQDKVETEYTAYQLLKQNPLQQQVNYLAIPWAVLINTNQLSKVPLIKLKGGFTICQHVDFEKIIPLLKKIGIDTLFTPHVTKNYEGIMVLPFPHLAIHGIVPAVTKDIWYSFIGFNTHWTRRQIFDQKVLRPDIVIKERTLWHFSPLNHKNERLKKQQEFEKNEYQDVLSRSRFSLCPRGTGASTLRFWESLQAGAIPVLIADDMRLPNSFNWDLCIVRISEKDVKNINQVLKTISVQQQEQMRQFCLKAFGFYSGENFVSVIRDFYAKKYK